jgi:predicted nucleic acid-binding protein
MIVVADTSPVSYLAELELTELLHRLYGTVLIPEEVHLELTKAGAPELTRYWANNLPDWVEIRRAQSVIRNELAMLDVGERAAIQLALEVTAELLLIDEIKARQIATRVFGFRVAGTLAVLRDSHNAGWIDGRAAFTKLCENTSFYHSPELDRAFSSSLTS